MSNVYLGNAGQTVTGTEGQDTFILGFIGGGEAAGDRVYFKLSGTAEYGVDYYIDRYESENGVIQGVQEEGGGVFSFEPFDGVQGFDGGVYIVPICEGITEGTQTIDVELLADTYVHPGFSRFAWFNIEDGSCPPPEIKIEATDDEAYEGTNDHAEFVITKTSTFPVGVELSFSGTAVAGVDYKVYLGGTQTEVPVSNNSAGVKFSGGSLTLRIEAVADGDNAEDLFEDFEIAISNVSVPHTITQGSDDAVIGQATALTEVSTLNPHGCTCFSCSCTAANAKPDYATGQNLANARTGAGQEMIYSGSSIAPRNLALHLDIPAGLEPITKFSVGGQVGGSWGVPLGSVFFGGTGDPRGQSHYANYQIPTNGLAIGLHAAEIDVTYYFENGQTATHTQTVEYLHLDGTESEFGAGWRPRGFSRLYGDSSGLLFDFGDGNVAYFRETSAGVFKADPSPFIHFSAEIVENLDGTYTYDDGHRNLQQFRADGYLTERIDRDGNVTEYVYSDLDSDSVYESLTSIVDPAGRATTLQYQNGKIWKMVGIDGAVSEFAHDSAGRLISITEADPDGGGPLTAPSSTFTYVGSTYQLASITNAEGQTVSYSYDANGYLASITETGPSSETITTEYEMYFSDLIPGPGEGTATTPRDYALSNLQSTKKIDHDGKVTEYFFNRFGQANKIVHFDGTITDATYSEDGLLLQSVDLDPDGTGPLTDRVTTYTYDSNGNVKSITYADDSTETFTYNLDFNEVTSYTDQLGRITLYSLDATYGRLTSVTRVMGEIDDSQNQETDDAVVAFTYTQSSGGVKGLVETVTHAEGNVTKFVYDSVGRVTDAIHAFGTSLQAEEEFEYDSGDRITAHENELGHRTEFVYDDLGRLIETIHPDLDGVGGEDPVSTFYRYNKLGYLIAVDAPLKREDNGSLTRRTTETLYEDNFYRVRSRRPDHEGDSDTLDTDTVVQYDWLGRIDSTTDELLRVTDYQYDSLRRLQKIVSPDPSGSETSSEISFTYDAWGRLKTQTDALGNVTQYDYDIMDRVIKITHPDLGGGLRAEEEFVYDDAGQLVEYIDALDRKTKYAYDDFGRLLSVTLPNANGTDGTVPNVVYAYDENGNLISETKYPNVEDLEETIVTSYAYDAHNRLISITEPKALASDPSAPVTQFGYYDDDSLAYVIDAEGRRTDYYYDAWGRLTKTELPDLDGDGLNRLHRDVEYDYAGRVILTTDALGIETNYEYDLLDNLKKVVLPSADGIIARATREYVYDAKSQLTSEQDELGAITFYGYDELGRLTNVTAPDPDGSATAYSSPVTLYEYDKNGQLTKVTDALLGETDYGYDAMGRRTSVTQPVPDGPNGTQDRPATTFTYDLLGRLTSETAPDPDGAGEKLAAVTSYEYDALGRLKKITLPDPDTTDQVANDTEYTYDRLGRLVSETDALGRVTTYDYDDLDRLTKVTKPTTTADPADSPVIEYGYDMVGQLVSVTDPLERVTSYEYDALGRRTKMNQPDPDGTSGNPAPVILYTYDAEGRLETETGPDSRVPVTTYDYDNLGRLTKRTDPDPDKNGTISNGSLASPETEYRYDAAGNLTKVIDPLDRETSYAYDALGRLTSVTAPDPGTATGQDPAITSYGYDALGRRTSVTAPDPDGSGNKPAPVTDYTYDALGRLTKQKLHDPDGSAPGSNGRPTTVYTYDVVGNLLSLTDPEGNVHGYSYDVLNRLVAETDPLNEQTLYEYDYVGNLTEKTDRRGLVTEYQYDDLDRRKAEIWTDGSTVVNQIDYTYDKADQLLSASDGWSSYAYTYDSLGRVKTVDNDGTYEVPRVILTNSYGTNLQRSSVSATIDGTADFKTDYTYDTLGRMTTVKQSQQSGGNTVREKHVLFAYNAASNLTYVNRYDTLDQSKLVSSTNILYDGAGRTTHVSHSNWTVQDHRQHVYTYDTAGRETSHVKNSITGGVAGASELISSSYDDTNQLTGTDYSTTQTDESYTYDENGNRTGTGKTTGTGNRVTSDGTFNYEYDDEGNRTKRTTIATGDYLTYEWDHRNRLTAIGVHTSAGALTKKIFYVYDVFDRRIAEEVDNGGNGTIDRVMTWVYDSLGKTDANGHPIDDVVLVFDGSGALLRRFVHGFQPDQILAEEDVTTGVVTWPLADKQGTIHSRVIYDRVADRARYHSHVWYDSFGKIVKQTDGAGVVLATYDAKSYFGAFGPTYAFQGREFEADADLYFHRARWYDYRTGGFVSEDPIFDDTTNTYRFVGNSPTNGRDPSGLEPPVLPISDVEPLPQPGDEFLFGGAIEDPGLTAEDWAKYREAGDLYADGLAYGIQYLIWGEFEANELQEERARRCLEMEEFYEEFPNTRPRIGIPPDPSLVPKNPRNWGNIARAARGFFQKGGPKGSFIPKKAPIGTTPSPPKTPTPPSAPKPSPPTAPKPSVPKPAVGWVRPTLPQIDDFLSKLTSGRIGSAKDLVTKSKDELAEILGEGWTCGNYGKTGTGWKFVKGDVSIFYHEGGRHGTYYGISNGAFRKVKFPSPGYRPDPTDNATIIEL